MIPSDHFIRVYNEMFKVVNEKGPGHFEDFCEMISEYQWTMYKKIFSKGLIGFFEYFSKTWEEENAYGHVLVKEKGTLRLWSRPLKKDGGAIHIELSEGDYFEKEMYQCPSLSKAMDNDAGLFPHYCDHCAGWNTPVFERMGYIAVHDMESRTEPHCCFRVYGKKDRALAGQFARKAKLPWVRGQRKE